jgi:hypothetical protein
MSDNAIQHSRDWLASKRANALAWWLPLAAIVLALLFPAPVRAAVWIAALIWMGTACLLNARRCQRTHCRYTGPYFIAMSLPVLLMAIGVVPGGFLAWVVLGVTILAGTALIWWGSEAALGKFSERPSKGILGDLVAPMNSSRIFSAALAVAGLISGTAALVAASCCALPLLLAGLGAGAGIFAALEILVGLQKPLLLFGAALVAAAWLVFFRSQGSRATAIGLTVATLLVGTAAAWGHIETPLLNIVRANR